VGDGLKSLGSVFKEFPDGVLLIDRHRKVVAMNPALEEMTGWSAQEAVGRQECHLLFSCSVEKGKETSQGECPGLRAIEGKGATPCRELNLRNREGKLIIVSASYSRVTIEGCSYSIGIMREITEKKRLEERLRAEAMTDSLTGVANLRQFMVRLDQELGRAKRYLHPLSLILLDVDYFKEYNDRNGHPKGSLALVQLAELLTKNSRHSNSVARYGGDEFAIVLPETGKRTAIRAAVRLRRAVQDASFQDDKNQSLRTFTISLGVASFPMDADTPTLLIEEADRALYLAKQRGRNRVSWCF